MLEAIVFIYAVFLGIAALGLWELLLPRAAAKVERWLLTAPLRLIKRRPAPYTPSARETRFRRLAGASLAGYAIWALAQFPIRSIQTPRPEPLPDNGVSRLIAAHIQPLVTGGKTVGAAAGAIAGGREWTAGYGRLRAGDDRAPDANTVFEIGSVTKVFTATALSSLVERGVVRLDDPVQALLPDGFDVPTLKGRAVTLRHLATHTSGLPRIAGNMHGPVGMATLAMLRDPYASYGPGRLRAFLRKHPLEAVPGERYEYSNLGVGLLGYALAARQRQSYADLIRREVCEPLGLKDTSAGMPALPRARMAQGFYGCAAEEKEMIAFQSRPWTFQDTTAGCGSLCSTVNDLLRFLRANLGEAPEANRGVLLRTHQVQRRLDAGHDVCLGWHTLKTTRHPAAVVWHNGGTGGCSSFVGFCREHGTGVVLLCNISPANDIPDRPALDLLYAVCSRQSGRP